MRTVGGTPLSSGTDRVCFRGSRHATATGLRRVAVADIAPAGNDETAALRQKHDARQEAAFRDVPETMGAVAPTEIKRASSARAA